MFEEKRKREFEKVRNTLDNHIKMNIRRRRGNNNESGDKNAEKEDKIEREAEEEGRNLNLGIFSEVTKKNQLNPDEYELRTTNMTRRHNEKKQSKSRNR